MGLARLSQPEFPEFQVLRRHHLPPQENSGFPFPSGSGEFLRAAASGFRLFGTKPGGQDPVLLAFAAGEEINERGGGCGCWTMPTRTGMKIRVTKARVKRAYGLGRRQHERDSGVGTVPVLHVDSGNRVLPRLALGVRLVLGGGPPVRQMVAAAERLADGAGQVAAEGNTPAGPQKAGQ